MLLFSIFPLLCPRFFLLTFPLVMRLSVRFYMPPHGERDEELCFFQIPLPRIQSPQQFILHHQN